MLSSHPKVQKDVFSSTSDTFNSEDITTTKRISHDRETVTLFMEPFKTGLNILIH